MNDILDFDVLEPFKDATASQLHNWFQKWWWWEDDEGVFRTKTSLRNDISRIATKQVFALSHSILLSRKTKHDCNDDQKKCLGLFAKMIDFNSHQLLQMPIFIGFKC